MEAAGKRYVTHPSRSDVFTLWGIGDLHYGSPGCDLKRAKADIQTIKDDPYSLWVGLGDMADYIAPGDKRFDADALTDDAKLNLGRLGQYYMEQVRDLYKPIAHKCLGMGKGNHEEKYFLHNNRSDGHAWLCAEMEVPNLQYSAIFDLVFLRTRCKAPALLKSKPPNLGGAETFRINFHHGSGAAGSPGGKLNMLVKHMTMVDADICLVGHVHDMKAQRMVYLGADANCTKLVQKQRVGAICGSYLRCYQQGHTSYGEQKGYFPTALGPSRVVITPEKRDLRVEV